MKTFYIPTSTSNFNNILSSESISPKAFYEKRGFGYSRWTTIPENPYNNAVVLYDNLCFFNRPKSDIEDHPLLVEVQLEESELKQSEGFWYSNHTIYLAPTTTRFLFFSETDKTITLSMSENSSETKLIRLYSKRIALVEKTIGVYKPLPTDELCTLNESEISKDFRINKMKGLLHGYYIGALLSVDLDSVKFLNSLKEIHNIFAAILSSFGRQPTQYQNERLDVLFKAINRKNTDYQRLFEIIGDYEKADKVMALDFVQSRNIVRKTDYLYYLQHEQNDAEKENPAIEWIKRRIKDAKNNIKLDSQLLSPDKSEIVVLENSVSVLKNKKLIDETEMDLCLAWFNKTLSSEETNGKISTYREKLADDITDEAIRVLGDKWKESSVRTYLNALRHHIAGEDFNQEWHDGLLSSIAAVVIAGEDWEKLLAFMQNKQLTDYTLAFAFYGELAGYANLLRDFTDLLYNQGREYVWDVYKEFYGQLCGKTLLSVTKPESDVLQQEKRTKPEEGSCTKQDKDADNSVVTCEPEHKVTSIPEELKGMFDVEAFKKLSSNAQQYFKVECLKLYKGKIDKTYIDALKKLEYPNSQRGWKQNWKDAIKVLTQKLKKNQNEQQDSDLFMYDRNSISDKIRLKYPNETKFIMSLDCLKDMPNKAVERLIDAFGYTATEKSKDEHIKFFTSICINEGRGYKSDGSKVMNKGLLGIYTEELNKKLKSEIEIRYNDYR